MTCVYVRPYICTCGLDLEKPHDFFGFTAVCEVGHDLEARYHGFVWQCPLVSGILGEVSVFLESKGNRRGVTKEINSLPHPCVTSRKLLL